MNFKSTVGRRAARGSKRHKRRLYVAGVALALSSVPATAQVPRRVVSINLCTDQLVLALADPAQIAGLGRFSRHAEMSLLAVAAARHPALRGTAEEVLRLQPDLVVAGAFSGRATRAVLTSHGVRLETFAPPRSIAEAKAEVERMAFLLGQPARGAGLAAAIDAAVETAAKAAAGRPAVTALAIQRRGFVSGRETLMSAAMKAAGLTNAAGALGVASVAHAPIETIVKLRPGVLILEALPVAWDQSTAVLHHPALVRAFPQRRLIHLPVAEVTCGGPALPRLIRRLAEHRSGLD